jgi:hypothetical protein
MNFQYLCLCVKTVFIAEGNCDLYLNVFISGIRVIRGQNNYDRKKTHLA